MLLSENVVVVGDVSEDVAVTPLGSAPTGNTLALEVGLDAFHQFRLSVNPCSVLGNNFLTRPVNPYFERVTEWRRTPDVHVMRVVDVNDHSLHEKTFGITVMEIGVTEDARPT
jgi:hypothetical protein